MTESRGVRKRAGEEQRFLANVGAAVSASLDYEKALAEVAALAVPFLADWCTVHVADAAGSLYRVLLVHSDPARTAAARDVGVKVPMDPDASYGVALAVRTGKPVIYEDLPRTVEELGMDAKRREFAEALGITSAVMVPLVARGRTLGAISLFTSESGRRYREADLPLIEEFARRASLAADNARLFSELQTASAAKDEFLGLVSHELRTPLTGIYGAVRILRARGEQLSTTDRDDLLEVLEHETERMNRLVDDLLVLSRLELGQEVMLEPVMAPRIIEKVLAGFVPVRGPRAIEASVEKGLPPVAAEPMLFEQVLRNLLNNAEKYSPSGTPVEVRAAATPEGDVAVSVLDRGMGIKPEEAERIFEPFYRSPNVEKGKGLGIGLTVCKRLTEAQSGRIWAKPREGGGVEIGFTLRRYEDEEPSLQ